MIPKIIMQTWETSDIPEKWKSGPESIKALMPDWNYNLLTSDDRIEFTKTYFPDFFETFVNFRYPVQQADAIRYMWLYVHGGLYMDLKIELVQALDSLFENNAEDSIAREMGNPKGSLLHEAGSLYLVNCRDGLVGNSIMASKPRHYLWLVCLREMKKPTPWWAIGRFLYVLKSTGPLMLRTAIKRVRPKITYLPRIRVSPCSVCEPTPCTKRRAYVRILEGGSWLALDARIYKWVGCNWKLIIIPVILIVVIVFIMLRMRR